MDPMDAHAAELAADADRDVVLGDLVALRRIRIEVVLAMEDRARRDLRAQREADPDREVDRTGVDDRERARQAEADRADVHVGRIAEREVTAAEHLGPGL